MSTTKNIPKEHLERCAIPIKKGYFDNYSTLWRTTKFDGVWLWKHPTRVRAYEFFTELCGHTPAWEDITDTRLRLFVEVLLENVCRNSAKTICAELKAIINSYCTDYNIPSRQYAKILTLPSDASEAIYLTRNELAKIRGYRPLSEQESTIVALFMIEALTGARHCDCERMTMLNVDTETNTIHYTMKKTRKSVMCPFHSWLVDYLPKDIDELNARPSVCVMTFNRTIRRICRKVGITKSITLYRRGKEVTAPKFAFVSSHTARRSFATNLYLWGAEIGLVSELMGHSDTKITLGTYIKEKQTVPEKVLSFFNG